MNRRNFLQAALGLAAPLALTRTFAAGSTGSHAMHNMDMGHNTQAMGSMMHDASPGVYPPAGTPLQMPLRLSNDSRIKAQFSARINIQPATINLLPGTTTDIWAYNGILAGPTIEVTEGDSVRINVRNSLAEATTIHWHGLHVPPDQDGNPWDAIPPGASRDYRFTIPENSAGTYWYHPHPHGRTAEQVAMGLAGAFIVHPKQDPIPAQIEEKLLFIEDIRVNDNGAITAHNMMDWMDGREGNIVLVNGQYQPVIAIAPGEKQRWRVVNACSARYLQLSLPGHALVQIASDAGLLNKPQTRTAYLLAPGERAEFIVTGLAHGTDTRLLSLPYKRGKMMGTEQSQPVLLASLKYTAKAVKNTPAIPATLRAVTLLGDPAIRRQVIFSEKMEHGAGGMKMLFLINGKRFDMNRVDFTGKIGAIEEWEIINNSDMDHPFHLHGTSFQVVNTDHPLHGAWKDVVNTRPGEKVLIRFRQMLAGKRLYHCHILEHEQLGMMGILDIQA